MNFDDADFALRQPASKNWNYDTPGVLRKMILLYANGNEARVQQLIGEVDAEVAQKRAALGGRKLNADDFAGTKWTRDVVSAEQWALRYTLANQ